MVVQDLLDSMCRCFNEPGPIMTGACGSIGQCVVDSDANMSDASNHSQQNQQQQQHRRSGSAAASADVDMCGSGGGAAGSLGSGMAALGMKLGNANWDAIFQTSNGSGGGIVLDTKASADRNGARAAAAGQDGGEGSGENEHGPPLLKGSSDLSKSDVGVPDSSEPASSRQRTDDNNGNANNVDGNGEPVTPVLQTRSMCGIDIENAEAALAQARMEANAHARSAFKAGGSGRTRSSSSRKGKRKADIFRSRPKPMEKQSSSGVSTGSASSANAAAAAADQQAGGQSSGVDKNGRPISPVPMGGFCSPNLKGIHEDGDDDCLDGTNGSGSGGSLGRLKSTVTPFLCFANPIHDSASNEEEEARRKEEALARERAKAVDDEMTQATQTTYGEETITSTLYFDNKFGQIVESRPPMPLYRSFRVECTEDKTEELTKIVKSDSHRSFSMFMADAFVPASFSASKKTPKTIGIMRKHHSKSNKTGKVSGGQNSPSRDKTPIARNRNEIKLSPDRTSVASQASSVPPPPPVLPPTAPHDRRPLVESFEVIDAAYASPSPSSSDSSSDDESELAFSVSACPDDERVDPSIGSGSGGQKQKQQQQQQQQHPATPTNSPENEYHLDQDQAAEVTPGSDHEMGDNGNGSASAAHASSSSLSSRGTKSKRQRHDTSNGPCVPELLRTPRTTPMQGHDVPPMAAVTPERTTPTTDDEAPELGAVRVKA